MNTCAQHDPSRVVSCRGGAEAVAGMFDRIAGRYDLLNRLLSLRRDVAWRRRLVRELPAGTGLRVLDLATGTADVLLGLARVGDRVALGVGLDRARDMLALGRRKIARAGLARQLKTVRGDALRLAVRDGAFDAVTMAFGVRNMTDVPRALAEMRRVLKPRGRLLILEFSLPANRLVRAGYLFYLRHVLPRLGAAISGDAEAYRYLNRTIERFPCGEAFCALVRAGGFERVRAVPLTFGIATLYVGEAGPGAGGA